jgi:phage terminase small subunit
MLRTKKQDSFIIHYIRTHNASESARLAGYSQKTAYSSGQRLLKDVEVKSEISRLEKAKYEELELTDANIIKRLWIEATTAQRSADRTNALTQLAKIKGLMKEQPIQSMAIFNQVEKELRLLQPIQQVVVDKSIT